MVLFLIGTEFIVDRDIAEQSVLLKNMLEDVGELEDFPIPLPNVTGPILQKVIEWCTHHRNDLAPASSDPASQHAPASGQPNPNSGTQASASGTAAGSALHTSGRGTGSDDIDEWDQEFCKVDQGTLFELILAANYLDIKPLLDLTCKTVANMIKGANNWFKHYT